jgi:hypothetical protein
MQGKSPNAVRSFTIVFKINGQGDFRREIVHLPDNMKKVHCLVAQVQDPDALDSNDHLLQEDGFGLLQENGGSIII